MGNNRIGALRRRAVAAAVAVGLTAGLLGGTAQPADAASKAGIATVKEYKKIKNGHTLKKVRKTVGGKGAKVTGITEAPVYVWRSTKGKNAYVLFDGGRVADKVRMDDQTVSVAEFKKLKKKQSYSKTRKTIRESGYLLFDYRDGGKRYQDYLWIDDTFTQYVWVEFVNGKLSWKGYLPVDDFLEDGRARGGAKAGTQVPSSVARDARQAVQELATS